MSEKEFQNTFEVHPNNGAGNCLFLSLGTLLGEDSMALRRMLFDYYNDPKNADIAMLNNEPPDINHNATILSSSTWGNATDIYVLSLLLNIDVRLYYYDKKTSQYTVITSNHSDTVKRILYIRLKDLHYEALFIRGDHTLIHR
jgi:hypothetical protein